MAEIMTSGREFDCLDAMRTARELFLSDVVAHAQRYAGDLKAAGKPAKEVQVAVLRSENTFQIAEFYYLAEEFKLNEPDRIACFIDRHNHDMVELLKDKEKIRLLGLLPQRVREAIFSEEQKTKVVENIVNNRLRLDQSDLGRFLSAMISPETCRKTVVALADGGLLERRNIGQVLVISMGVLENYYRKHLRHIVDAVSARA